MSRTVDRKLVLSWTEELDAVGERLSPRFARSEVRSRARSYLRGLLGAVERKNSWQLLAEVAGDATPYGLQHLLGRANWDADGVRETTYASTCSSVSARRRRRCSWWTRRAS